MRISRFMKVFFGCICTTVMISTYFMLGKKVHKKLSLWISNKNDILSNNEEVTPFVVVICKGNNWMELHTEVGLTRKEMQLRQLNVMLKSAASLTSSNLTFLLLTDETNLLQEVLLKVQSWPTQFQEKLRLITRDINPGTGDVIQMYERCSAERLFVPWVLPEYASAVYLDTDVLFLRPPENLISVLNNFDSDQVFGFAQLFGYYEQTDIQLPYPPPTGIAASIFVANLTRWRQLPFDWREMVDDVAKTFKPMIHSDQDILNIIMSVFPERLHLMTCTWLGSPELCLTKNWRCPDSENLGFFMLHGARWRFFRETIFGMRQIVEYMKVVFRAWEEHQMGVSMKEWRRGVIANLHKVKYFFPNRHDEHLFCTYDVKKTFKQIDIFINNTYQDE